MSTHHAKAKLLWVILVLWAGAQVVDLEVMLVVRVEESDDFRLRITVHGAHAGAWQAHGDDLLGVRVRCESRSEGWIYRVLVGVRVGVRAAWSVMYVRSRSNPSCCRRSFCFDTRRRATHVMERRRATASGDVLRTSGEPQSSRARIMVHSQSSYKED